MNRRILKVSFGVCRCAAHSQVRPAWIKLRFPSCLKIANRKVGRAFNFDCALESQCAASICRNFINGNGGSFISILCLENYTHGRLRASIDGLEILACENGSNSNAFPINQNVNLNFKKWDWIGVADGDGRVQRPFPIKQLDMLGPNSWSFSRWGDIGVCISERVNWIRFGGICLLFAFSPKEDRPNEGNRKHHQCPITRLRVSYPMNSVV